MATRAIRSLAVAIAALVIVAVSLPVPARANGASPPGRDRPEPPGYWHAHRGGGQDAATDTIAAFSGRAFGAQVKVVLPLPSTRIYADTGLLGAAGGSLSASLTSITDAAFSSGPTSCTSQASNGVATSAAAITQLSAFVGAAAQLSVRSVQSTTRATCLGASGSCSIDGLVFAGASVVVTGVANQTVSVPGVATLVINEQIKAAGSITVNGLHLTLATGEEIVIASSHSDIECSTPTRQDTWGSVKAMYR